MSDPLNESGVAAERPARPGKVDRREQQRKETRKRVFEAALEIFRRDGVAAARIEDIAARAEVSRGTFYFHFPAKDDVLAELLRISEARVAAIIAKTPARRSLPRILEATTDAIAAEWQDDPRLLPDVGVVALRLTAAEINNADGHPARSALRLRFREAADAGALPELLPAEVLADIFLVNAFAASLAWCSTPILPLAEVLRQVGIFFYEGLSAAGKRLKKSASAAPRTARPETDPDQSQKDHKRREVAAPRTARPDTDPDQSQKDHKRREVAAPRTGSARKPRTKRAPTPKRESAPKRAKARSR